MWRSAPANSCLSIPRLSKRGSSPEDVSYGAEKECSMIGSRGQVFLRGIFVFVVGLMAATVAWGQATARLTGTVKDQSGAVIAGASVTLTNEGTNISRTTKTDGEGNYLFALVDVGP